MLANVKHSEIKMRQLSAMSKASGASFFLFILFQWCHCYEMKVVAPSKRGIYNITHAIREY